MRPRRAGPARARASRRHARRTAAGGRRRARRPPRPVARACRSRARARRARAPAPARATPRAPARRGGRLRAFSSRAHSETIDDVAEDGSVRVDLSELRPRSLGSLVGVAARTLGAVLAHVAVRIEDVVDDLKKKPELPGESSPG